VSAIHFDAVTTAEMREIDRVAIEEFGVPGVVLMENAGAGAAAVIRQVLPADGRRVSILAGRGNNGGDAFVVARHLLNRGLDVSCRFAGNLEDVSPGSEAGINLFVLLKMGVMIPEIREPGDALNAVEELKASDLIVDGLLGTGTRGTVREPFVALIEGVNALPVPAFALDLPSGLDADSGRVLGHAIQASHTATFACVKKGFFLDRGPSLCGTVHRIDIGMPRKVVDQVLASMRNEEEDTPPA